MGGTWFLGRAVVDGALARGWEVTTFNRGRSGTDAASAEAVRGDRTDEIDLYRLAEHGPWDAVIDTSASELPPRVVLAGARALAPVVGRYVYISTVSVYQGWPNEELTEASPVLPCPPDAGWDYGRMAPGTEGPDTHYGTQKAGAENAVLEAVGKDRVVLLRPGVILGPGEYVGRLPWWLRRAESGGRILAPGRPDRTIQPIDVRDVASFALDQAAADCGGTYNVAAPVGRETMGAFLAVCLRVTGSSGRLVWAGDEFLVQHGVRQWTELPLWRTNRGVWRVRSTAHAAGLRCRPLAETVADTWAWLQADGRPVDHPRAADHGIARDKESALLDALADAQIRDAAPPSADRC